MPTSSNPLSDVAIKVEGLGKRYRIGASQPRYRTIREKVNDLALKPLRAVRSLAGNNSHTQEVGNGEMSNPQSAIRNSQSSTIWALKDVSFEVKLGEVVGIIGRNGAGKSTLLKVLSRITEPTTGAVDIYGRVGSLLEVGTGFHPELTGRENIFLNAAILGMRRIEIERKFDEIVAFAEVEQFIDTPVKHYSSGMYVRLAFAVAAHLQPEILLVDEVLAVGDAQFQKKCLGKMSGVAHEGRTVLFVSHNMAAISNLCPTAMLLNNGNLVCFDRSEKVIEAYQIALTDDGITESQDLRRFRPPWAQPLISSVRILNAIGEEQNSFALGSDLIVEMRFKSEAENLSEPVMGVVINHLTHGTAGGVNTRMSGFWPRNGPYRSATMRCNLHRLPLLQGTYTIDVWLGNGTTDIDTLQGCLRFTIEATDFYGTGQTPFSHMGLVFFEPVWEITPD